MKSRLDKLAAERARVEQIIMKAVITIQRYSKGWITRRKLKQVEELTRQFERAKLDEVMAQM